EPDGADHDITYRPTRGGGLTVGDIGTDGVRVVSAGRARVTLEHAGVTRHFDVLPADGKVYVDTASGAYTFTALPRFTDPADRTEPGSLLAPMPGTVVRLADGLAEGAAVEAGQPLIWLEAMKMEHRILAPASGTLTALHAAPGLQVEVGALLAVVTDPAEEQPA
ncbi:acetyl-CoA carboxylase biotin carboxyl carrier protein subunit, partial [Streptomyces sp. DT225]